jgi:hypothetical protein
MIAFERIGEGYAICDATGSRMKALKGSSEEKALVERYVRELNDQEDRVHSLQQEILALQQKRDVAQKALTEIIEGLELEATL